MHGASTTAGRPSTRTRPRSRTRSPSYRWLLRPGRRSPATSPPPATRPAAGCARRWCSGCATRALRSRPRSCRSRPGTTWRPRARRSRRRADADVLVQRDVLLNMAMMFLGDSPASDPLANPLYADPRGLPPMLIQVGDHETLLDDSHRFARLATDAGVDVTVEVEPEMQHVFHFLAGRAPEADDGHRPHGRLGPPQARPLISPARAGAGVTPRAGSDAVGGANDQRSSVRRAERRTASSIMRPASSTKTPPSARAAASSRRSAAATLVGRRRELVVDDGDLLGVDRLHGAEAGVVELVHGRREPGEVLDVADHRAQRRGRARWRRTPRRRASAAPTARRRARRRRTRGRRRGRPRRWPASGPRRTPRSRRPG